MEFIKNAPVFTTDNEQVGKIDRVVLDPKTKEVTHIVIRKGFIFTENKVLPISLVASGGEQVTLRENAGDLQAFPEFEEQNYVLLDETERKRITSSTSTDVVFMYPYTPYGGIQPMGLTIPLMMKETERNIPDQTIALQKGAAVISAEGDHIGNIEEVLTDPQADRITHFVISQGLILKERKLVPVTWVNLFQENKVHLSVGTKVLDSLSEYKR